MPETPLRFGCKKRSPNAESRAWVRYPCNAEVSFRLMESRKEGTWQPAKLRDISTKGLGLLLETSVQRGAILSVKLEGASERLSRPVLVRVVRISEQPGGGCRVGGTFAIPLSEEELRAFLHVGHPSEQAPEQPPRQEAPAVLAETHAAFVPADAAERRVFARRRISVPVMLSSGGARENTHQALAIDISRGGLRLLTPYSFGRGTILEVRNHKAPRGTPSVIHVRVRSCSPQQAKWVVGAQFLEPPPSEVLMYFS